MPVSPDVAALLHRSYDAFNRRDISAVLATLHRDVDWPNMIDGGRIVGHDAIREYWTRQFHSIDPHVEPLQITEGPQGEVVAAVIK
jgi:ketosteroid isomerase-like protein